VKTSSNAKEVAAMSDHVKIKIADLIGSELCISAEDGQKFSASWSHS
jgi:hypothetical protein